MDSQTDQKLVRSIVKTKEALSKHISRPVLLDKYLGRPPFRFLLEIVNNVVQQTKFMEEVFSPQELTYEEVTGPEDKRTILKKLIDAIEKETGEKCDIKCSKVLSGKEADKTNEMLQLLAKAITSFKSKASSKKKADTVHDVVEESADSANKSRSNEKSGKCEDKDVKKRELAKPKASSAVTSKKSSASSSTHAKTKTPERTVPMKAKGPATTTATKPSGSSCSVKVTSQERVKPKASRSPSASSSSTLIQEKRSPNLPEKSRSRQSISSTKLSTSASNVAVGPAESDGRNETSAEESVQKSNSQDKIQTPEVIPTNKAALPPETNEEVPLQRPVTRTKFRMKTAEGEGGGAPVPEEVPTPELESSPVKGPLHEDVCVSARSSSSDEVVTENMNEKISEWRSSSPEQVAEVEADETVVEKVVNPSWIPDDTPQEDHVEKSLSPTRKVFESEENCVAPEVNPAPPPPPPPSKAPVEEVLSSSSKQVCQRPITVLRDNEPTDDDDESFLVQEKLESERDLALERLQQGALLINNGGAGDMAYLPEEHRGLLVNQIMETQRELERLSSFVGDRGHKLETEMAERDKAAVREVYLRQIEDLKGAIQKMSKCANPLANIIQRSQDDACLMEIEFRKLRQENERLQRKIDEAKTETSRILYPLTEELAQLDDRIEKVEGVIILAKQRLSLIDYEYAGEFLAQIENTPTEDEASADDPVLQFRGSFLSAEEEENGSSGQKSLLDVFQRAVSMHEGACLQPAIKPAHSSNILRKVGSGPGAPRMGMMMPCPAVERRLPNRTVFGEHSLPRSNSRVVNGLDRLTDTHPVDKEIKPSWWD